MMSESKPPKRPSSDNKYKRQPCPNCGEIDNRNDLDNRNENTAADWVLIMRLADVAEAGYFYDILEHESISVKIHQTDDFDAMFGRWTQQFLLLVDRKDKTRATEVLQNDTEMQHHSELKSDSDESHSTNQNNEDANRNAYQFLDNSDLKDSPIDDDRLSESDSNARLSSRTTQPLPNTMQQRFQEDIQAINWKPIVWAFLAGSIFTLVGFELLREKSVSSIPSDQSTLKAILGNQSLRTKSQPADEPRKRLMYRENKDYFLLETDANGDGVYEKQYIFQN